MALTKPPGIESDAFKSTKWDEITAGRDFAPSDAPTLALLCRWGRVAQQTMSELIVRAGAAGLRSGRRASRTG